MTPNKTALATERRLPQDLKQRREEEGWKRLVIWLTPQQADTLQTLGSEWLTRTVDALLTDAIGSQEQPIALRAATSDDPIPKDRREEQETNRLAIWLTPKEADTLQTLGDAWLEHRVKALLADAMGSQEQYPILCAVTLGDSIATPDPVLLESKLTAAVLAERARTIALLFRLGKTARDIAQLLHLELSDVARVLSPPPEIFTLTGGPATLEAPPDRTDLMREVDALLAQGLSGMDIAQQLNAAGRRATSGAEYCGANLIRDWRRWKAASI
jgi:hypothetical protein